MKFVDRLRGRLDCEHVMDQLQEYLDGEIDATTSRKISAHLARCAACGLEHEAYARIKASLGSVHEPIDTEALARLRAFVDEVPSIASEG